MIILVGSTAAKLIDLLSKEPTDFDVWTDEDLQAPKGYDVSRMPTELLEAIPTISSVHRHGKKVLVPTADALYTIKLAHLGWDIFWDKHKAMALVMEKKGAVVIPELYRALVDHWKIIHGNKDFLSLYKDKTQFFNDYVEYIYPHDELHELVAFPNPPVYTRCLKEGEDVAIDEEKFRQLDFATQVRMFKEEIVVIACERWLIPETIRGKISWQKAYSLSLRKTVTSLTKNWATEFIVLNLKEFVRPDRQMFQHISQTLKIGEYYGTQIN